MYILYNLDICQYRVFLVNRKLTIIIILHKKKTTYLSEGIRVHRTEICGGEHKKKNNNFMIIIRRF